MPLDRDRRREWQRQYMRQKRAEAVAKFGGKCVKCGATEDLHFDHVDPSTKRTHRVWGMGQAKRDAELAKCQLLCAACHRAKTRPELQALIAKRMTAKRAVPQPRKATYEEWLNSYRERFKAPLPRVSTKGGVGT